jgi:hypothetical protein
MRLETGNDHRAAWTHASPAPSSRLCAAKSRKQGADDFLTAPSTARSPTSRPSPLGSTSTGLFPSATPRRSSKTSL